MLKNSETENQKSNQFNLSLSSVYEGPIDLLLDLARKQKVNLSDISILDLANQYISFINNYNNLHLEVAADYLVMAAWLTYLKSRLLLPKDEKATDDHTPEDLEEALKYQLQRLEMVQKTSKNLYSLPILNRDIFYGGSDEGLKVKYNITYTATLFDVLNSYANILSKKEVVSSLTIPSSELHSVDQALKRIKSMFGSIHEWTNFMTLIPEFINSNLINKSSLTSTFVASLELAKNGLIEVKQKETFGNIFVRYKNI
jgi:segregation and condensation protein A